MTQLPLHSSQVTVQVTVIVTCYNQAPTLRLLLTSLKRQTISVLAFEVVIVDDGSSDSSAKVAQEDWGFRLKFVTQEDLGYRKSKILNQAIRQSQTDYIVFLDADVVLEKHFLEDHLTLRKVGHFVCGRRVDLGPEFSHPLQSPEANVGSNDVMRGEFDSLSLKLLLSGLRKDSHSVKRGLRIVLPWLRKVLHYDRPVDLLGSNFSLWKADILAVNGFNEAMESYWGEDGDLFIRLRNSGKSVVGAKGLCIQFHIFHARRPPSPENIEHYQKLLQDREYRWALKGYQESKIENPAK